jgi:adenylylsulfate kinase-like enzyme
VLLDLLYHAHRDVSALYFETRDIVRRSASVVLFAERGDDGTLGGARWLNGGPYGASVVSVRRVWFQQADRVRVEVSQAGTVVREGVRDGSTWWCRDGPSGESAGDLALGQALPSFLDIRLVRPEHLLSAMWFTVTGAGHRAGREVLTATAHPRGRAVANDERMEFEFDREHGTTLYVAQLQDGDKPSVTEVTSIDYKPSFDPDVFSFTSRDNSGAVHRVATGAQPGGAAAPEDHLSGFSKPALTDCATVWLTGISGAGKTTIARAVERLLSQLSVPCCVLDGDELREGLNSDIGPSREGYREAARRVGYTAATLASSGIVPIVALVSPYAADRERARAIHQTCGLSLIEVWVDTPLEICDARDPNRPSTGGSRVAYEAPGDPQLRVSGYGDHPRVAAVEIISRLFRTPSRPYLVAFRDA